MGEGNLIFCCTGPTDPNFRQIKVIILKSLKILKVMLKHSCEKCQRLWCLESWISVFIWFRPLKFDAFKAFKKVFIDYVHFLIVRICHSVIVYLPRTISKSDLVFNSRPEVTWSLLDFLYQNLISFGFRLLVFVDFSRKKELKTRPKKEHSSVRKGIILVWLYLQQSSTAMNRR